MFNVHRIAGFLVLCSANPLVADQIDDRIAELDRAVSGRCEHNSFVCAPLEAQLAAELRDLRWEQIIRAYDSISAQARIAPFSLMAVCEGFRQEGIARETKCAYEWGQWLSSYSQSTSQLRDALVGNFGNSEADRLSARSNELGWKYWPEMMIQPVAPVDKDGESEEVIVQADSDGHFRVEPQLDGITIKMLVDTGASFVLLTSSDASAIGFDLTNLAFDVPVMTAAGEALFARGTVRNLTLFGLHLQNQSVLIAPPDYSTGSSLLGMSVLREFGQVSIQGSDLLIRP
ncbi:retropepsin-like aspartic protease family protein [Rubellimicrobium aerolatum]|uniref:TIGR02281 family clan AA aspartic protease n=1 Tax=Rubellimicrobium aerolatum TaxID=490979 RepID=A0ABW0S945_9RHOB|nr:TIGR02281 family clan AA aspartic protease [Rubellimicrobium aerolatum]MBP1804792.1 clan AA aspartic protease (TIGR02281 family) [Rubellimicrobium aerolatum]